MQIQINNRKSFFVQISSSIHQWIENNFPIEISVFMQIGAGILILFVLFWIFFILFKVIIDFPLKWILHRKERYPFLYSLYEVKTNKTFCQVLAVAICGMSVDSIFELNFPRISLILSRLIDFLMVILYAKIAFRALKALEYYFGIKKDHYRVIAMKTLTETLRPIGVVVFTIIGISIVFGINGATIFGYLSAFIAVFFLIFRDFILGFIAGLHVATQRTYKVGDWIRIEKYNLEGTIEDISSLTSKIRNFDRTISTIPTYDLLNTEVKNYEAMKVGNKRRIKKAITFNINSFKFLDDELYDKLKNIHLIADYLETKMNEIEEDNRIQGLDITEPINSRRLTNIGVFRKYVEMYLLQNPNIDHNDTILARQRDITPKGMPLEIYCFTIYPDLLDFERVQADIFDHLLVAAKTFELQVAQVNSYK